MRKKGKLPAEIISQDFELEYGKATIEMHKDSINKEDSVLIVDDLVATGGTAEAVCRIVESLGGQIVQCNFIMEINQLEGAKKISPYPIFAAVSY